MKRAAHVGVVVARGIGLMLILMAVVSGISAIEMFFPRATSGWTSYSPLATPSTSSLVLQDTYFVSGVLWGACSGSNTNRFRNNPFQPDHRPLAGVGVEGIGK